MNGVVVVVGGARVMAIALNDVGVAVAKGGASVMAIALNGVELAVWCDAGVRACSVSIGRVASTGMAVITLTGLAATINVNVRTSE